MFVTICGGIHFCYGDQLKCDFLYVNFHVVFKLKNLYNSKHTDHIMKQQNDTGIVM